MIHPTEPTPRQHKILDGSHRIGISLRPPILLTVNYIIHIYPCHKQKYRTFSLTDGRSFRMMIWPHAAQSEYREPQLRFSLPSFLLVSDGEERAVYGFFWVSELYWIEVLGLICCELVLAALTGAVVYKLVVAPGKCGTSAAYLLGWGVLLPLWIAGPTSIDQVLNLRNLVFKFVVGGVIPTLTIFRLTEAIYGCTPHYATGSMSAFVVYFASVLVFERDEKTGTMLKATLHMAWLHFKQFLILLFTTGALQSMLTPHADMNLFGQPITSDGWLRIERLATWQLYANSFLHAGTS